MMASFARAFFRLIRFASLLILICGTLLWVTSYWRQGVFYYESAYRRPMGSRRLLHVMVIRGRLHAGYVADVRTQESPGSWVPRSMGLKMKPFEPPLPPVRVSDLWRILRVARFQEYPRKQGHVRELTIVMPFWIVVAVSSVLPATSVVAGARRRRRLRSGKCAQCGYDLRASAEVCPECGTRTPQAAATPTARDSAGRFEVGA